MVLCPEDEIRLSDLPEEFHPEGNKRAVLDDGSAIAPGPVEGVEQVPVGITMEEIEKQAILRALEQTGGNRTKAAEMLGIGLRTLQRKLKEYRTDGED